MQEQELFYFTRDGNPVPRTDSKQSKNLIVLIHKKARVVI